MVPSLRSRKTSSGSSTTTELHYGKQSTPVYKTDTLKKHGFFQSLRSRMLARREQEVPVLQKIQSYRNKFLDHFFFVASICGEELFYIFFLPYTAWNIGSRETAHFVFLTMFLCIGIGNMLKNTFLIPRPDSTRVWTPEGHQKTDHGFPSTHTLSFLTFPLYFIIYQYFEKAYAVDSYFLSLPSAIAILGFCSVAVIFSRMYNGYHSPQDVMGGIVIGLSFLSLFYFYIRHWLDSWLLFGSPYAPLLTLSLAITSMMLHPKPQEPTAAFPESGMVIGTSTGTIMGIQICSLIDFKSMIGEPLITLDHIVPVFVGRLLIGFTVVAIIRQLVKKGCTSVAKQFFPEEKDANLVLTIVKFVTYWAISISVFSCIPIMFHWTGFHLPFDLAASSFYPTGYFDYHK